MRSKLRMALALPAVFGLLVGFTLLGGSARPAYAYSWAGSFFIYSPPGFCAETTATEDSPYPYSSVNVDASTITANGSSCGSQLPWPWHDTAARAIYWDSVWPSPHICVQEPFYSYNPTGSTYSYADQRFNALACGNCAWTSSDSYVLVGYPATWQQGSVLSSGTCYY